MKKIKIGTFLFFLILSSLCQAASSVEELQEKSTTSRRSIWSIFNSFSGLFSTSVHAEDIQSDSMPKYSAVQIIDDIKNSTKESYLKDGLLIKNPLFSMLTKEDEDVIKKFEAVINKINKNVAKKTKTSQGSYTVQYYPEDKAVDSYLSAGE